MKSYPDGEYILHEYRSYTTDMSADGELLFDVFESSGTYAYHYTVKNNELLCNGAC